jgi:CRP-like cAMP-binding protein
MSGELSVDELRTLFLFEQLTDEQLAWIAERAEVRTFDEGVVVYREGEPATHLFILLAGRLQVLRMISGENVEMLHTEHRGAYAGAIRAYVEPDADYGQTLVTTRPSSFLRLRAEDFASLMRAWFPMAVHLLDGSTSACARARHRSASVSTSPSWERCPPTWRTS